MFGKPKPVCEFCNQKKTREIDSVTNKPCCPDCQARLALEREDKYRCPTDGNVMEKQYVGDLIIDRCPLCHGVWLGKDELETIREAAKEESQFLGMDGTTAFVIGLAMP